MSASATPVYTTDPTDATAKGYRKAKFERELADWTEKINAADSHEAKISLLGRCCMIQLRREWGRFSNFSFRTPQRRIAAYPARPSG